MFRRGDDKGGLRLVVQCQVNGWPRRSLQAACDGHADSIFKCEVIGPHEHHKVGEHTIWHERYGNGRSCAQIESLRLDPNVRLGDGPTKFIRIGF